VDGSKAGLIDYGRWGASEGYRLQETEGKLGEDRQRKGCDCRKDGVRMGDCVVAANTGIDLGGVLDSLQIVSDGDDGKEDEDEHCEGDPLGSPGCAGPRCKAQPEANDHDGRKSPREIED